MLFLILLYLGQFYFCSGYYRKGFKCFEKLFEIWIWELDGDQMEVLWFEYNIGEVYVIMMEFDKVYEWFKKVVVIWKWWLELVKFLDLFRRLYFLF